MSLINGSLQIGASALSASQAALQIIGSNVANASNPNYARERPDITSAPGGSSQLGSGVQLARLQRLADEAINARLRGAQSDQSATQAASDLFTQIETMFNTLGDNNLSTQMTAFFNAFSQLANDPQSASNRNLLLQAGNSVSRAITATYQSIQDQRAQVNNQLDELTGQANQLIAQVANLNGQITTQDSTNNGNSSGLRDQRDAALAQLSQLINIHTQTSGDGNINVYLNSSMLVQGTESTTLVTAADPNSTGAGRSDRIVALAGTKDAAGITGGQIGGLLTARSQGLDFAQDSLNKLAAGLINAVNQVHTQGQGLTGVQAVTATQSVSDPNAPLNQAGLGSPATGVTPVNGTFNILVTGPDGQTTTQTITVNLNGTGADDSLGTLAQQIGCLDHLSATVSQSGRLSITAASGYTISFAQDTSGALAALGINTFFSGHDASDIAVRSDLTASGVAAALNQSPGDNSNALNLAALADQPIDALGGLTLGDYFGNTTGTLATRTAQAKSDNNSANTLAQALSAQQAAISGVNTDEETIDLMKYQQAYEGAAHYISVINQLMTDLIQLV